jgi:hypothetical protein
VNAGLQGVWGHPAKEVDDPDMTRRHDRQTRCQRGQQADDTDELQNSRSAKFLYSIQPTAAQTHIRAQGNNDDYYEDNEPHAHLLGIQE